MRALFPALICWLLFCFLLGILSQAAREVAKYFLGPESPVRAISRPEKATQVVILGGGFAGVTTAEHLEKQFRGDPTVSFTLISETNSWLFTPMLVEVATSGLEPTLVLALGSVSNYPGNTAVAENALEFKTLADAMRIRNQIIDVFERADSEPDPGRRRALLTFVVAGGGFSGAELAGGMNDFARGIIADYPNLSTDDLRIILVHSRGTNFTRVESVSR